MFDINLIRQQPELVKTGLQKRQVTIDLDHILALDQKSRDLLQQVEQLRSEKNKASKEITLLEGTARAEMIQKMKKVDTKEEFLNKELNSINKELNDILLELPNIPKDDVGIGENEKDNKVIKTQGQPQKFAFPIKDYITLGQELDLIDIERATKISGSRFGYLKNQAVLLESAILRFAMDILLKENFIPLSIPLLVKKDVMGQTGYSSYTSGQEAYWLEKDELYLIGTGEHSLVTYRKDEVIDEKELPLRYMAFSPCFRREAGSYGKDTKGIMRVHQFNKLEMVSIATPEKSDQEFEFLLGLQEKLVQALKLPYQLLSVCTGDLPKPSAKVIDLECFIPSENRYRETHSVSNCTDFQSRRLNIKFKNSKIPRPRQGEAEGGQKFKTEYVHTLNGTAFAMPRIIIAIMENYLTKEGAIKVPEVLVPYMGMREIKK